jgi:hypothetical protein
VNGYSGNCYKGYDTLPECVAFLLEINAFLTDEKIKVYHNTKALTVHKYGNQLNTTTDSEKHGMPFTSNANTIVKVVVPNDETGATQTSGEHRISNITDLSSSSMDIYSTVFVQSVDAIFQYIWNDIANEVSKVEMNTVLHKNMCGRLAGLFSQFKERRIVNRMDKRTMVYDTLIMRSSIANKLAHKDRDKIFLDCLDKEDILDSDSNLQTQIVDCIATVAAL